MLNIKKVTPMANYLITTKEEYTQKDVDEMIKNTGIATVSVGTLKEYQKVVAVGPTVRHIKEGDYVVINPKNYAKYKHQPNSLKDGVITDNPVIGYNFRLIDLDHVTHLVLTDQDIMFKLDEFEEEKPKSSIIKINSGIIS